MGLLIIVGVVLVCSWIGAYGQDDLVASKAFPALIGIPVLAATYRRFPLTRLAYVLVALHVCILLVGAHYTYERVPLFNWVRDHFHLLRNDYDKVGHLAQGFIPAILACEVLIPGDGS